MTDLREIYSDKRIGVLMGGMSGEREISLESGKRVLQSLLDQGFRAVGIDVDRGTAARLIEEGIDVAFIMLHGRYGEDGTIQGLLEHMGIPYTGSGVLASALSMNKLISKKIFFTEGVPTPEYVDVSAGDDVEEVVSMISDRLPFPVIIKPIDEGSSLGIEVADNGKSLNEAIRRGLETHTHLLVERFIEGTSVTVGIIGLDGEVKALPVLELRPEGKFYDYDAKYTPGMTNFICPARLDEGVYHLVQHYALVSHYSLGCRGFSRVDIQVDLKGQPFVLEVNTIPGMTRVSDLPAEAEAAGMSYNDLVLEILKSARIDS